MNPFERLESDKEIGSSCIFVVNLFFSLAILAVDGVWVVEHVLAEWFFAGMTFWFIMAYIRLREGQRAEFVAVAKKWLLKQWGGTLLIVTCTIGWFATMFHYPSEHVAASPLVSFYRDQAMPWQYPLAIFVIMVPFTIGYPLALIVMNKVMKPGVEK